MTMEIYIDRGEALRIIRSFISELRPESTGLICEIYDAVVRIPPVRFEVEEKEDV